MGKKAKKLLAGIIGFITAAAVATVNPVAVRAREDGTKLQDINVGVAEILDTLDRGSTDVIESYTGTGMETEEGEDPYSAKSNLVMANVKFSLNVREEPNVDAAKVGLLYADCGGTILARDGDWTKLQSGNVTGWCHNDYLLFDREAEDMAVAVGRTIATVNADALRVRKEPGIDADVWGIVKKGDEIEAIIEDSEEDWVALEYEGEEGFIASEYVTLDFSVDSGETIKEIKEREQREKEEKAKLVANLGAVPVGVADETLLGALVYCEAGNQSYEGKLAVAAVVMNRVRSGAYPNTVAGVIYASGQFTPAQSGKVQLQLAKGVPESCLQAAREAISGMTNVGGATHFRRYTGQQGYVIGAHVFW